jgi:MFS family permease
MLQSLKHHYVDPVRSFGRPARLFLAMVIINGVIFSFWQLFFNFYILQSGYTREFLGLVNAMPYASGLILGIPLGRLSDRIGRRLSIILGLVLMGIFMLVQIAARDPAFIVAGAFLYGIAYMLFVVSQAPLMAKISGIENRTMLFSLSYGLQTLAGSVGSLFAGQLPALFGSLLRVGAHTAGAYQAVLITSIVLGSTAIVPMWMMDEAPPESLQTKRRGMVGIGGTPTGSIERTRLPRALISMTFRLTASQLLIGFGAAILIPYMNVFFKDTFGISDSLLGVLFSISALLIGVGSLVAPRLSTLLGGKIRAVVVTQAGSLCFLLLCGFAPFLWLSAAGYLIRTALMNMASPLYSAFCMERTPEQHQGFVNSILNITWTLGWAVGPFISGLVQEHYGFKPLFVATAILYATASGVIWHLFRKTESLDVPEPATVAPTVEFPE